MAKKVADVLSDIADCGESNCDACREDARAGLESLAALEAELAGARDLAGELVEDLAETCDCDSHQESLVSYRERLAALSEGSSGG
jgi:hypothetical protein